MRAMLVALYIGMWGAAGLLNVGLTDLEVFFQPAARIALAGYPLFVYHVRVGVFFPFAPFGQQGYPDANGPLSLIPLTLVGWLAQRLGWLDDSILLRMLTLAAFSIFALLLSREAVRLCDAALDCPLRGRRRLLACALFAFSPELWRSVLLFGHIEQPILLWLTLAATRLLLLPPPGASSRGTAVHRALGVGALLGLALLTRSTAILYLLPLACVAWRRNGWRAGLAVAGVALSVAALGLAPFWLADRADLVYSLLTFHASQPVTGGVLWGLSPSLAEPGAHADSLVMIGLAALLSVVVCFAPGGRKRAADARCVVALLALCSLCFPLFDKALWPYYAFEPYTYLALWWLLGLGRVHSVSSLADAHELTDARARWRLGAAFPLLCVIAASLDEYALSTLGATGWSPQWSALTCGAALVPVVGLSLWLWLWRRPAGTPTASRAA